MSYSTTSYTGDGSNTNFAVPFPFINRAHVTAKIDEVSTAFTWLSDGLIQFATAPAADSAIVITRNSSQSVRLVDFQDGTVLTEVDLDNANLQAFYMAQEAFDASAAVMGSTELNNAVAAAAESALEAAASAVLAGGYAGAALGYLNSDIKTSDRFEIVSATADNSHPSPSAEGFTPELVFTNPFAIAGFQKWKIAADPTSGALRIGPENAVEDTGLVRGISMQRGAGGDDDLDSIVLNSTVIAMFGRTLVGFGVVDDTTSFLQMTGDVNLQGGTSVLVPVGTDANAIPFVKIKAVTSGADTRLGIVAGGTAQASPRLVLADRDHADHMALTFSIEANNYAQLDASPVGAGVALPLRIVLGGVERMRFHSSGNRMSLGGSTDDLSTTVQIRGTALVTGAATFNSYIDWFAGTALLPGVCPTGDPDTGMWSPGANILAWSTAGVERMRISATGVVTIGGSGIPTLPIANTDVTGLGTASTHAAGDFLAVAGGTMTGSLLMGAQVIKFTGSGVAPSKHLRADSGNFQIVNDAYGAVIWGLSDAGVVTQYAKLDMVNFDVDNAKTVTFNGEIDDSTSGTSKTIDFTTGQYHKVSMTGNCTFTFTAPAGPAVVHLKLTQDATGSRTMTLPSGKWPGSYAAGDKLLSTAIGAIDILTAKWDGAAWFYTLTKAWA